MKCINMKIVVILFFTANFISIISLAVKEDKTTNVMLEETPKNKSNEGCPDLVRMIRSNGLSDFIFNCKASNAKGRTLQEEVLRHACFVVKNMFSVVCNKNFRETSLDLLGRDNTNMICPFNFSYLKPLGLDFVFTNHDVVNTLTSNVDCQKICYEFYSTRTQCVVLSKFNDYLKLNNPVSPPRLDKSPAVSPQIADSSKTSQIALSQPNQSHQEPIVVDKSKEKSTVPNTKTETVISQSVPSDLKSNIQQETSTKIPKKGKEVGKPVTAKDELKSIEKTEIPQLEIKDTEMESDKQTPINDDDKFTDGDFSKEESLQKLDELSNGVVSQELDSQKVQNLEDKENPYLREKDSYVAEGFPQAEDSHFFFYFIMMSSIVVIGYLAFHNKNKILAYALEGSSSRRSRRRPNPARYRKLETNLEEVISSNTTNATTSSVVY